jgi:hypothetical protein
MPPTIRPVASQSGRAFMQMIEPSDVVELRTKSSSSRVTSPRSARTSGSSFSGSGAKSFRWKSVAPWLRTVVGAFSELMPRMRRAARLKWRDSPLASVIATPSPMDESTRSTMTERSPPALVMRESIRSTSGSLTARLIARDTAPGGVAFRAGTSARAEVGSEASHQVRGRRRKWTKVGKGRPKPFD